jgi:hypothetical protein
MQPTDADHAIFSRGGGGDQLQTGDAVGVYAVHALFYGWALKGASLQPVARFHGPLKRKSPSGKAEVFSGGLQPVQRCAASSSPTPVMVPRRGQ